MRIKFLLSLLVFFVCAANAEANEDLTEGLEITAETQISAANETTPLWLNANKYGLSSLDGANGYVRVSAIRDTDEDKRQWKWGYGLDVAVAANYTSTLIIQQAFAEMKWKKLTLSAGAKHNPVEYKNQELSSGAMIFGCNARPIPKAQIYVDWFSFPGTKGWWKWKFHGAFGMTTDANYQTSKPLPERDHYTNNVLYHEKALYWKFGKEDHEAFPLTYELALQMAAQFGGTSYNIIGRDHAHGATIKHKAGFMEFIHALTATGTGETDGSSKNTEGNHLGSWNMRLTWHGQDWKVAARFERFFEDQSMMFIQYGIYDHLVGIDVKLPRNRFISDFTIEHLSTYDQSGAILHDAAPNIPDKMNGMDNYYNHSLYIGYQHWGQALGNPLLTSTIYNKDNSLIFKNNRVKAWHLGLTSDPLEWLHCRALASFSRNWGTYDIPLDDPTNQNYYLVEASAAPKKWKGWELQAALGIDAGKWIGNNTGAQFTVRKKLKL